MLYCLAAWPYSSAVVVPAEVLLSCAELVLALVRVVAPGMQPELLGLLGLGLWLGQLALVLSAGDWARGALCSRAG